MNNHFLRAWRILQIHNWFLCYDWLGEADTEAVLKPGGSALDTLWPPA